MHTKFVFMFILFSSVFCGTSLSAYAEEGRISGTMPGMTAGPGTPPAPAAISVNRPAGTQPSAGVNLPVQQTQAPEVKEDSVKLPAQADGPTEGRARKQEQSQEPSEIEKFVSTELSVIDKAQPQPFKLGKISQFGYDFFKGEGGFAPLVDIPVGPEYAIGAGDRLLVTLWGSIDGTYELEVNRAGEIVLPRVGAVKVAGQTFGNLPTVLKSALSRIFKDFQLNVNMARLRLVKVYVVGEVNSPGDYNLTSLSTVINALGAAGGPTKHGSLRTVEVRRGGRLIEKVDLYDFFLKGDKSRDIRLQAGDTVFVPVIGKVAGIVGNVKRPAIYELKDESTLKDLFSLAEGTNPSGYLQRVQISRVVAHQKKMVTDMNLDPKSAGKPIDDLLSAVKLQDMDVVRIFPIDATLRDYVRLDGLVLRPGHYALRPGMRVSGLLKEGELLPEYFREAQVTRLIPPDYHPETTFIDVDKALTGDPQHDLQLMEFDQIKLFSRWEMEEIPKVRIGGQVLKPGEYRLFEKMTVRDLVMQAGNLKMTAYLKNAEVNRLKYTGATVTSFPIRINLEEAMKGNPKENILLMPFDEVTVRQIPNWAEEADRYVTLKGEFMFPGVYPIYKGEKLSSVIERAGGFTDKAYVQSTKFTRNVVRELQQKRMDEAIAKAEDEMLRKEAELASLAASKEELEANRTALENLKRQTALLKTKKAEGRVIVSIRSLEQLKASRFDVELMGGDVLEVSRDPGAVNVIGQVYNPTSLLKGSGETVEDYLEKVGGPTKDAEEDDMYLVRVDGSVISRQQTSGLFKFDRFMSRKVESGDTIVVPQQFEKTAWMRDIKDIATILGQVALAAGVLIAAGL